MSADPIDFAAGGVAVVVLARNFTLSNEWINHRHLLALSADRLDGKIEDVAKQIPPDTKVLLIGGALPGFTYQNINAVMRRRGVPVVPRPNLAGLEDALRNLRLPKAAVNGNGHHPEEAAAAPTTPARHTEPPTTVRAFVEQQADLTKSNADEARRIVPLAKAAGVTTTTGSVAQILSNYRKRLQSERDKAARPPLPLPPAPVEAQMPQVPTPAPSTPPPPPPPPQAPVTAATVPANERTKQAQALLILDQAIESLMLVRDYVKDTEEVNTVMSARLAAIEAVFKSK